MTARSALLLLIFSFSIFASAQTPDTATIHGVVTDQSQAAIPGVQVTATNSLTRLQRSVHTDHSGSFSLAGLPVSGRYAITASRQGFADAHLEGITLSGGTSANLKLELSVTGGETQVDVTGIAGEVRTDEPQLGDLLGTSQVEETPLLNRRITFLPLLNAANRPAINQGDAFMNENLFTTNGGGRRQAWFEVDGGTGDDLWGRQTIFSNIPVDAVQEMTVLENAFSAEYGASAGSVVNIVTRSGGNQFHGDALGLFRPSSLGAKLSGFTTTSAANGNDLTSDKLTQGAASLGGPIGASNRTHFFLSGEYSWQDRASPITSPIAPGSFVGDYRGWLAYSRLDHQINQNNTLFLVEDADNFHDTNPNGTVGGNTLPTVDRIFKRRTYSTELGETAILSSSLLNNARLQFQLASPITEFDPVVLGTQFVVPTTSGGTFTTGTSQSALLQNRQYQVSDTLSASWGRHQVRFGADVIHAHNGGNSKEFGGPIFLGQFTYKTCTQSLSICESPAFLGDIANVNSYTQSFGNGSYTVDDTLWALFVQDDFRVRSDVTFNFGLRYEQQTFTDSRKDFAPRFGFVYNLRGHDTTTLRGGFGIYYSQVVDNSEANYALSGPTGVFNFTAQAGQIGFPQSVSAAPLQAFPSGAVLPPRSIYIRPGRASFYDQFFPVATLTQYPDALLNPYSEQWTLGIEHQFAKDWVLSMDYVGSHTVKINRPLDVDAPAPFVRTAPGQVRTAQAANCTRPFWMSFYSQNGLACNPAKATGPQPPYTVIQTDVNDGYAHYNSFNLNLNHRFTSRFSMLASYVYSRTSDNVDPDVPQQNPNDPNFVGAAEYGDAIFDQRHRFVLSGFYVAPLHITVGGVGTLASGLPFNITTGANNFGDPGATADRPVIDGVVVGRNTGRGRAIYEVSPFVERPFPLGSERVQLDLRAEAFNVFNHANFVGYNGVFGNGATLPANSTFGQPLAGITNQLAARSFQFSAKLTF